MEKEKQSSQLPTVQELFKESWELFKKTIFSYLKLIGLSLASILLGALIGMMVGLPALFTNVSLHIQDLSTMTPFGITVLILVILWSILYLAALLILSLVMPIVSIEILQGNKPARILQLIKHSKHFIVPYFLASFVVGVLILGGMILLFIPGLLIAFFFMFVSYEIVVEHQSGRDAMRRSYLLIKNNFWEVFVRVLLIQVGVSFITWLMNKLATEDFLFVWISVLFSFFAGWFTQVYLFLLYKQVRARTKVDKTISIRWIVILSSVGWGLFIAGSIALVAGIGHVSGLTAPDLSGRV